MGNEDRLLNRIQVTSVVSLIQKKFCKAFKRFADLLYDVFKFEVNIELVKSRDHGSILLNCSNWDETAIKPLK